MTLNPDTHLLIGDIETTGLDARHGFILEVGLMVVDLNFKPVGAMSEVVLPDIEIDWDSLHPAVREMHSRNGLRDAIDRRTGQDIEDVEEMMLDFYTQYFGTAKVPLVGSSIHFDVKWIDEHLVDFADKLHYRIIDTSSVKELCRRFNPRLYSLLPEKQEKHRVLPDMQDTLGELHFYADNFLFTVDTESDV